MSADTLEIMFREFRLPTMAARCAEMMASAEVPNLGYRKLLVQLCEAETADRRERKRERLLKESCLPQGKTLGNLAEQQLPDKVPKNNCRSSVWTFAELLQGELRTGNGGDAGPATKLRSMTQISQNRFIGWRRAASQSRYARLPRA
jgi:hypothetical protein